MEVQVKGLDKLLKKLDKLGGSIPQSTQKALLKGGAVFEAGAKAHCPVDTGNLRDSIHTEAKSNDQVVTGTSVKYGPDVEFGTGPKGDPSVPHTPDGHSMPFVRTLQYMADACQYQCQYGFSRRRRPLSRGPALIMASPLSVYQITACLLSIFHILHLPFLFVNNFLYFYSNIFSHILNVNIIAPCVIFSFCHTKKNNV